MSPEGRDPFQLEFRYDVKGTNLRLPPSRPIGSNEVVFKDPIDQVVTDNQEIPIEPTPLEERQAS